MSAIRVLMRGSGDAGSAVAHRLHRAGASVVVHDDPGPTHTRRRMAFTDALFVGRAELAGVFAKMFCPGAHLAAMLRCGRAVPLIACPLDALLEDLEPDVLVDARMRKRAQPEVQCTLAPPTIGLGPNFVAGEATDLAVETARGNRLGAVIPAGRALEPAGEPQSLGERGRERFVYAPLAGVFRTLRRIGDAVRGGEHVATIGEKRCTAPLDGFLRGLSHDGVRVESGTKVIEVDPRRDRHGLGVRPMRSAQGVVAAINQRLPGVLSDGGQYPCR